MCNCAAHIPHNNITVNQTIIINKRFCVFQVMSVGPLRC